MRPSILWSSFALLATALAVWGTLAWGLGVGMLEYNLGFAALALAGVASWPLLLRRRVASVGLAFTGVAAILTGFWLLWWKEDLKAGELKDFAKFWHSVTSFAMIPFFAAHYVRNWPRLRGWLDRAARGRGLAGAYTGGWIGLLLVGAGSWLPDGKVLFTEENYLWLTWWAWLLVTAAIYFTWVLARMLRRARPDLAHVLDRTSRRTLVDVTLLGSFVLAMATGFLLLYFKAFLHGNGFKYVSKFWHTSTSIAFTAFVVLHVGANLLLLGAHLRRLRQDLDAPKVKAS